MYTFITESYEVKEYAFEECNNLKEVVFNEGLRKIDMAAFQECKLLERIIFPSTLTEIDVGAFQGCIRLKEVIFNEGLRHVGKYAFAGCNSLEKISLPKSLSEIGGGPFSDIHVDSVFCKCTDLRSVEFKEGLQKIGANSFEDCTSLERITFPSTLAQIDKKAFLGCTNLREITFNGGWFQKLDMSAFDLCTSLETFTYASIATRFESIPKSGESDIENKFKAISNEVDVRDGKLCLSATLIMGGNSTKWKAVKEIVIDKIIDLLTYYEIKEATTLFELALWKAKIDMVQDETNPTSRQECRMEVPGPAKELILQYLSSTDDVGSLQSDSDTSSDDSSDDSISSDGDGSWTDRMLDYIIQHPEVM